MRRRLGCGGRLGAAGSAELTARAPFCVSEPSSIRSAVSSVPQPQCAATARLGPRRDPAGGAAQEGLLLHTWVHRDPAGGGGGFPLQTFATLAAPSPTLSHRTQSHDAPRCSSALHPKPKVPHLGMGAWRAELRCLAALRGCSWVRRELRPLLGGWASVLCSLLCSGAPALLCPLLSVGSALMLDHSLLLFLFFCLRFCMPLFFCIAATVEAVEAREGTA